jgi:transposase
MCSHQLKALHQKESAMNATTVGVDLAKNRFELAVADAQHRVQRRERLSRRQFERFFGNFPASRIVVESCGSAHYWARTLRQLGHEVELLPAQYVRAYLCEIAELEERTKGQRPLDHDERCRELITPILLT